MSKVYEMLLEYADSANADFQAKLTPNVERKRFLGVRIPDIRKLAKEFVKDEKACDEFFCSLPHYYYDENIFHGILISYIKDYERYLSEIERFLPYIDNWAVCDIYSPKAIKAHKADLFLHIEKWIKDNRSYVCRYGMGLLMGNYLDEYFKPEYLELPAAVRSEEYYVNMMTAWFFATALAKQWDAAVPYIAGHRLDKWTHNKAIQKACESFRVTDEHKEYLKTLRRK